MIRKFGLLLVSFLAWACTTSSSPVCVPSQACVPAAGSNACLTYATACDPTTGASSCVPAGTLPDGATCGSGNVCLAGACVAACAPGLACVPTSAADPCRTYATSCSSSTSPATCVVSGAVPDGSTCGSGSVCLSGGCISACVPGVTCVPSLPVAPCKTYATACSNKLTATSCAVGGDQPDGTACGSGLVCSTGSCIAACVSGTSCVPVGPVDPCKAYSTTCTSTLAQGVCAPSSNLPDGTPCQEASTCQAGACLGALDPPTLSPAGGTGDPGLQVTLTAPDPTATIYYTTDGSVPSDALGTLSASFVGSGVITLQTSAVVQAFASLAGRKSATVIGVYTITTPPPSPPGVALGSGFTPDSVQTNGSAIVNGTRLQLTSAEAYQVSSSFYPQALNVQTFTTEFSFQITNAEADGITFTLQGNNPYVIGSPGGGLGYGRAPFESAGALFIDRSVAVKFDIFSNEGEGQSSTGIYVNGATPSVPFVDMTPSGILLRSGHVIYVRMVYDGSDLVLTVSDPAANPPATFTTSFPIDIPLHVGDVTGFVGFTGATGRDVSSLEILNWTYVNTR